MLRLVQLGWSVAAYVVLLLMNITASLCICYCVCPGAVRLLQTMICFGPAFCLCMQFAEGAER